MSRVVLDTNVLASGFVGRYRADSTPGALLRAWRSGAFELVVSEILLTELTRTLGQPYFHRRLSAREIANVVPLLRREAIISPRSVTVVGVATHPEDDLILATAVSAAVDYLITGDKHLHGVGSFRGVHLLSPRAFLDLLTV